MSSLDSLRHCDTSAPPPTTDVRTDGIVVFGAGGHAAEVCAYIGAIASSSPDYHLLGCIDDYKPAGTAGLVHILGDTVAFERLLGQVGRLRGHTAIGDNPTRREVVMRVEAKAGDRLEWLVLQHPAATVGRAVEIGEGSCLAPGSIATARVRIGRHCILNVKASVSHDSTLGDFVNLNPGATVAGNVQIGAGCYVGAGATIIDRISVGEGTVVGAGAVVVADLPPNVVAVGVPARVIKHRPVGWAADAVPERA